MFAADVRSRNVCAANARKEVVANIEIDLGRSARKGCISTVQADA